MTARNFIAYDFAYVYGGAERVMADLCEALNTQKLHVGFSATDIETQYRAQGIQLTNIKSPSINWLPFSHAIRSILGFSQLQLNTSFDIALASGFYAPLCLPKIQANKKVYYCHTPPRFLFDLRSFYKSELSWMSPVLSLLDWWYLPKYLQALEYTDVIIANSKNVQSRLADYCSVDSHVVNPCIESSQYYYSESEGYYLSVARHESYKRLEVIIDAFKKMPKKQLVITSGGSKTILLKKRAAGCNNISFTGWLNEKELRELISSCTATLYLPKDEDFGISPLESMACGKPVVGVDEGGVKETVLHEQTGYLCPPEPSEQNIIDAVNWLSPVKAALLRKACETRAAQYDRSIFLEKIKSFMFD